MHGLVVYVKEGFFLDRTYPQETLRIFASISNRVYFIHCLICFPLSVLFQTTFVRWQVNFPTGYPVCDSCNAAVLDLLISSDPSICSTVAFTPLRNSVHVVVVVFIYFQSYTKSNALFCCTVFSIYHANWDCLHDYLGDASCEDILKIAAYVDVLCLDWVQGGTDIYIIYHKYLVKLHSFLWFSAACAAVKAHKKLIAHKLIKMTSFISTNRINLGGLLRLDRSV